MTSRSSDDRAVHLGQLAQPGGGERRRRGRSRRCEIDSTVLSLPSTISAPVRPRRIRSRPSRRAVPGAMDASVARSRSTSSVRSFAATSLPGALHRPALAAVSLGGTRLRADRRRAMGSRRPSAGRPGCGAVHLDDRRAVLDAEVEHPQRGVDVGHLDDLHAVDGADRAGVAGATRPARSRRGSRAGPPRPAAAAGRATRRSSPARPISPIATTPVRDARCLAVAEASAIATARSAAGSVSRAPPTVEAKTSWVCSRMPAVLLEHGQHHRDPGAVQPGRRTPGPLGGRGRDQRLHLGQQRPAALQRHRDAGAGDRLVVRARRTARSGR